MAEPAGPPSERDPALAVSRRVTESLGVTIEVESTVGEGSRSTLRLPG
jgi:chemotaxis protein histidine kinase CheA